MRDLCAYPEHTKSDVEIPVSASGTEHPAHGIAQGCVRAECDASEALFRQAFESNRIDGAGKRWRRQIYANIFEENHH